MRLCFRPKGVLSARESNFLMIDKIEAPDANTVVFHLKFPTTAFLPAIADPFNMIYEKKILDKDPRWYETHVMGSGPFKFVEYQTGQSIKGEKNPDYYHKGLPYLDGVLGIFADKQAVRVDAIRSDRAAIEFRSMPPSARDELKAALGDKLAVQQSDWNVGSAITPNHKKKPFDDVRGTPRAEPGDRSLGWAPDRCQRSRSCTPSAASCFPARLWRRPSKSCSRSPATGPISRNRGLRRDAY